MATSKFTLQDVRQAYKSRDAWWTVLLVDPIASRMIVPIANHTKITPNQLSVLAFILGLGSAYSFYLGTYGALVCGALLYHLSFILDCMDGKVARLKGTGTVFGMWVDYTLDRVRVIICAIALTVGQVNQTGHYSYLYLAFIIISLDTVRYMNALHLYKIRREMKRRIKLAKKALLTTNQGSDDFELNDTINLTQVDDTEHAEGNVDTLEQVEAEPPKARVDLQQEFKSHFGYYLKIRDWLENKRIRSHLFSGIEYQMFIFIIAPIIGFIPETVLVSSIVLFLFEAAIIYKLWLSTKDFQKEMKILQNK